ncbi:MAG: hypothetical protein RSB76_03455 [Clostridia bacterium]
MAIASMVLGILSLYTRFVINSNKAAFLIAGIACIMAIIWLCKSKIDKSLKPMAVSGLTMSLIVILFNLIGFIPNIINFYTKVVQFWFWI